MKSKIFKTPLTKIDPFAKLRFASSGAVTLG